MWTKVSYRGIIHNDDICKISGCSESSTRNLITKKQKKMHLIKFCAATLMFTAKYYFNLVCFAPLFQFSLDRSIFENFLSLFVVANSFWNAK